MTLIEEMWDAKWQARAEGHEVVRWRMGHDVCEVLIEAYVGKPPSEEMRDLGADFERIYQQEVAAYAYKREVAQQMWSPGHETCSLWGVPIDWVEGMTGWEPVRKRLFPEFLMEET